MDLHSLSKEELIEQAEILELSLAKNASEKTIIKAIQEALGEAVPDEDPGKGDYVEINFANDQKNKQPVFFGLNGKSYRFPRGKFVKCPRILLPTIRQAVKRVQDEDGSWVEMDAYPYQIKGE